MRITRPILLALALVSAGPAVSFADNAPAYIRASVELADQGRAAAADERLSDALLLYEQAVVANPKNVTAYIGLGQVHELYGNLTTSMKYYDVALELEPTSLPALEAQAMVYLQRDEVDRAEENLTLIRRVCRDDGCEVANRVTQAIGQYLDDNVRADNN